MLFSFSLICLTCSFHSAACFSNCGERRSVNTCSCLLHECYLTFEFSHSPVSAVDPYKLFLYLVLLVCFFQDQVCLWKLGFQQLLLQVSVFEHLLKVLQGRRQRFQNELFLLKISHIYVLDVSTAMSYFERDKEHHCRIGLNIQMTVIIEQSKMCYITQEDYH